jgi:hypothetical protein
MIHSTQQNRTAGSDPRGEGSVNMPAAVGCTRVTLSIQPIVDAKLNHLLWATCYITKNQLLLREFIFLTTVSIEAKPTACLPTEVCTPFPGNVDFLALFE